MEPAGATQGEPHALHLRHRPRDGFEHPRLLRHPHQELVLRPPGQYRLEHGVSPHAHAHDLNHWLLPHDIVGARQVDEWSLVHDLVLLYQPLQDDLTISRDLNIDVLASHYLEPSPEQGIRHAKFIYAELGACVGCH